MAVGTFGKAFGYFGAFALLPSGFKEYLFNFSSPLIYSTTLPEAHAASALDLLEIISRSEKEREALSTVSALMKEELRKSFTVTGDAHIVAVEIGDEALSAVVSARLFEKGIFVFPARFPTVPLGKAILRISLTALHTKEDTQTFAAALKEAYEEFRPKRN